MRDEIVATSATAEASAFMTVPEAGRRLGVAAARAYAMAAAGTFPTVRLAGRRIVVPRLAFEAWLQTQAEKALANVRASERVAR